MDESSTTTQDMLSPFIACLSSHAPYISGLIGWYSAGVCGLLLGASILISCRRCEFKWTTLCTTVILFHPAWTMSEDMGDCRYSKRFFSVAIAIVVLSAFLFPGILSVHVNTKVRRMVNYNKLDLRCVRLVKLVYSPWKCGAIAFGQE
jgi:hypothetical protein